VFAPLVSLALAGCVVSGAEFPGTDEMAYTEPGELQPAPLAPGERLRVVATTSILADVVANVGGDEIELSILVPLGVDPHAFEPTPQDARLLASGHAIFVNGLGLELFLEDLITQAGGATPVVSASSGIDPLTPESGEHEEQDEDHDEGGETQEGDEADHEEGEEDDHQHARDPHVWTDPRNVIVWTENIETALQALDPEHASAYAANAGRYRAALRALDREVREIVARIPPEDRVLVTDHDDLGYFAAAYGFTVVGTVIPGTSSLAEPSAAELARLLDEVRARGAPAVFVSSVVNPSLVETLAADAGLRVVTLYTHSLTLADGPAAGYLDLMRYNARAIADALAP
jgi:ABC-type Zn uptake system ZnuABC Zn-binding protein ZnuA